MAKIIRFDGKTYRVNKVYTGVGAADVDMLLPIVVQKRTGKKWLPVKNLAIRTRIANKMRK